MFLNSLMVIGMVLSNGYAANSSHSANAPFYPRTTGANQDLGGINNDLNDIAACFHNSITKTLTPQSCPAGQTLTGAQFNSCGTTFGGTCTTVPTLGGNNSWTGTNTFSSTTTLVTTVVVASSVTLSNLVVGTEWSLIASTHTTSSSLITIYQLVSTPPAICGNTKVRYKLTLDGLENTGTTKYIIRFSTGTSAVPQFDATSGDYVWNIFGEAQAGNIAIAGTNDTGCSLMNSSMLAGADFSLETYFYPVTGAASKIALRSLFQGTTSSDTTSRTSGGSACMFAPSGMTPGNVIALQIVPAATFTGDMALYMRCTP